jgi:hypothetical protein
MANGTTQETPENAIQTTKSRLVSTICRARSQGTIKHPKDQDGKSLNIPLLDQDGKRKD